MKEEVLSLKKLHKPDVQEDKLETILEEIWRQKSSKTTWRNLFLLLY